MHSALSLSAFALAMIQSLAAASPVYQALAFNNSTLSSLSSVKSSSTDASQTPAGTGIYSTHPHPSSPPSAIGTGVYSTPQPTTSPCPTANTTVTSPSGYTELTTITSVVTNTKTLTWTVYVPCTTIAHRSTSYYSTASVYTTCVTEYQTLTLTKSAISTGAYVPPVVDAEATSTVGPIYSTTATTAPGSPNTVAPSYPNAATTCPPAVTVTISSVKTITMGADYTVTMGAGQTVTVTEAYNSNTVTAAPSTTTSGSSAEHGICRPGASCYSRANSAWNATLTTSKQQTSGRPAGTGTAIYPHYY